MIKNTSHPIVVILVVIWLVWIVDLLIPAALTDWGLHPRTLRGLVGIPLSPFLHGGFGHVFSNTIPLAILLFLTVASRHRAWPIIITITLAGGVLLWLFGRNANHVGASGLIFGLITYLLVVGFRERNFRSLGIALVVGFFFGGTLVWGVLPTFGGDVSWDGHLCGAIAGGAVGYATTQNANAFA